MSINMSKVSKALQNQLQLDIGVASFMGSRDVALGEYVNERPELTPWIGVYRGPIRYEPRTLGVNVRNWEAYPEVKIAVQATHFNTAEECEELLEDYVQKIIDAAFSDRTVGNTVSMINAVRVEYLYNETDRETLYFQTAIITLELEVDTA